MSLNEQDRSAVTGYRLAYCAGYFDGEGCIWVGMSGNRFYLRINIATGDYETLLIFKELFGGVVMPVKASSSRKNIFHWMRDSSEAVKTLSALLPFMTSKREEAQLVVDFGWELVERGTRLTEELIAKRRALRQALKEVRKKGRKLSQVAPDLSVLSTGA
jgi:uncharacterized membrane protein